MSKFDRNGIQDGSEKLCTNKQTDRQTDSLDRHYENNGHSLGREPILQEWKNTSAIDSNSCLCDYMV